MIIVIVNKFSQGGIVAAVILETNAAAYTCIKFLPVKCSSESSPSRDCIENLDYDHSFLDNIQGIVTHTIAA